MEIFKILFWYEVSLNVLLWIIYDWGREYFGAPLWIVIVLILLIGIPAVLYVLLKWVERNT